MASKDFQALQDNRASHLTSTILGILENVLGYPLKGLKILYAYIV